MVDADAAPGSGRWQPGPSHRSASYPILLALGALDAAGYSIVAPVLPAIARTTRAGPALIGALVATFPIGIFLGFPIAGREVARGRSRRLLFASLALVSLGCLGFVIRTSLVGYFAARFVMGLGSGCLWIGVTFGTLERWPGQEYLCMSRVFAAYSVGGLIGPALGALGGIRGPFLAYLGMVGCGVVLAALLDAPPRPRPFRSDRSTLRRPAFILSCGGILYAVLGLGVAEGLLPLHFAARLSQPWIGGLFVGVSMIVAIASSAAARVRPRFALMVAVFSIATGLVVAGASRTVALWILALVVNGVGIGMGNTGSIGVLLEAVETDRIVTAMVVWSELGVLGYLLGPLAGGAVAQALGFSWLGLVPVVAGSALLVGLLLVPPLDTRHPV